MATALKQQLDTYEKSIESAHDKLMLDHHEAMVCCDVEELVALGISLFEGYERMDFNWRQSLASGKAKTNIEYGLALREMVSVLTFGRARLLEMVQLCEDDGYTIAGADEFRSINMVPFDERPFAVHFSESELQELAMSGKDIPDKYDPEDDDL